MMHRITADVGLVDVGPFVGEDNLGVSYECCISQLYTFKCLMRVHL